MASAFQFLGTTPWEITSTLCAVAGVVLLARRNIYGWPLGIVWAAISAWLAWTEWQLVSDAILYGSNIPILILCWVAWSRKPAGDAVHIQPRSWQPRRIWLWLAPTAAVAITLWAAAIHSLAQRVEWIPEPDLLWRDSASTVLNYFAQALQGMRRMECWVIWLVVNLLGVHIYSVKGLPIYATQYALFLALGLYGWWSWQRTIPPSADE